MTFNVRFPPGARRVNIRGSTFPALPMLYGQISSCQVSDNPERGLTRVTAVERSAKPPYSLGPMRTLEYTPRCLSGDPEDSVRINFADFGFFRQDYRSWRAAAPISVRIVEEASKPLLTLQNAQKSLRTLRIAKSKLLNISQA